MTLLSQESRYRKIVLKNLSRKIGVFLFYVCMNKMQRWAREMLIDYGHWNERLNQFDPHGDNHLLRAYYFVLNGVWMPTNASDFNKMLEHYITFNEDRRGDPPWFGAGKRT